MRSLVAVVVLSVLHGIFFVHLLVVVEQLGAALAAHSDGHRDAGFAQVTAHAHVHQRVHDDPKHDDAQQRRHDAARHRALTCRGQRPIRVLGSGGA